MLSTVVAITTFAKAEIFIGLYCCAIKDLVAFVLGIFLKLIQKGVSFMRQPLARNRFLILLHQLLELISSHMQPTYCAQKENHP